MPSLGEAAAGCWVMSHLVKLSLVRHQWWKLEVTGREVTWSTTCRVRRSGGGAGGDLLRRLSQQPAVLPALLQLQRQRLLIGVTPRPVWLALIGHEDHCLEAQAGSPDGEEVPGIVGLLSHLVESIAGIGIARVGDGGGPARYQEPIDTGEHLMAGIMVAVVVTSWK